MPLPLARFPGLLRRVAFVGCCATASAHATVVHDAAWVDCDSAQDRLTIRHGLATRNDPAATLFWSLISFTRRPDGEPEQVGELRSARHTCRLSGGLFEVVLRPVPMQARPRGQCYAIVRGGVTVLLEGKPILERELDTAGCTGSTRRSEAISIPGTGGSFVIDLARETR